VDIILGKERRRWSREDKLAIVAESFEPGAVILEVARRRQVSSGQIHTWRRELRAELGLPEPTPARREVAGPVRLLPLAVAGEMPATTIDIALTSGTRVKITGAFDADAIAALMKTLVGRPR
jgi:transposase